MPLTTLGKNSALNAIGVDRVGAFTAEATKTVLGDTTTDIITANGHGYANGNLVIFEGLTGGSGIIDGSVGNADEAADPYFVVSSTANTFQVALTPGGAAVDLGTNITAGNARRLTELAGGTYARVVIAYAAASGGILDDSTNGATINTPAGAAVDYVGYWNNGSGELRAIDKVPQETYSGAGEYVVQDSKISLN